MPAPTKFPGTFDGLPAGLLRYSAADSPQECHIFPAEFQKGETIWIPATSRSDANSVLEQIVVEEALIFQRTAARTAAPAFFEGAKDLAFGREAYLNRLDLIRQKWEAGGRVLTPEVAQGVSDARSALRADIRARYKLSGFAAKAWDVWRYGGTERYNEIEKLKLADRMARRQYQLIIDKATTATNDVANKLGAIAKARLPVVRALSVASNVAVAIEIPYRYYQLDQARTDEQRAEALSNLSSASASLAVASICVVFGIGTGGLGFLACGVAPIAAGVFAGSAAIWIFNATKE